MPIIETIKIGLEPNDGQGDNHRSAFQKVILNFSALNTAIQGVLDTKGQANGFASLDGNGRLLAAQAPLVYAAVLPTSAHDLNDFIAPGTYHQNTNVGAATGTHYPTPYAGLLLVRASATNFLYQFYTRFRSGPGGSQATYWRTFYANVWSDWQEVAKKAELDALSTAVTAVQTVANAAIPIVQKGAASGVASLDSSGHLPAEQAPIMYAAVLPTATHTLNDYVTPGVWYQASIAGATAGGASYPTAQVGFLEVVATGTPVLQVFTTRNATPAIQQRFWRVRVTSTTWSNWKEVVDTTIAYTYQGGLASGVNLNDYTQRGTWVQASSAAAAAGINYPIAQSGYLSVLSAGYPGGSAATGCSQIYHAANSNRLFYRSLVNSTWTDWVEVGRLDANGRIPNTQFPLSVSNPAGTDANNLTSPGLYYNNSDAQATAALNWPEQLAGSLFVEAAEVVAGSANQQITQTYTTRNGSGGVMRTYKRVRFGGGAGVWGLWQELARRADAMSHVYLTSATDANTLTADNTWWTAANSSVVSGGANFPPAPVASSFIFTTQAISATYMVQTCMMTPGSNRRPIEYRRIGNGSTAWSGWRIIAPVQLATDLPTADCGDIYVDGEGIYRWNGSAYARWFPSVPQNLTFSTTGVIEGNWLGSPQGLRFRNNSASPANTYVNIVPGTGGSAAGILCADKDNTPNAAYGSFNISDVGVFIESGRFGSAAYKPIVFYAIGNQLGRINTAATWELGPTVSSPVLARVILAYDGASSRYGISFRPGADETRPCHFSNAAGNEVGFIATGGSSTFYSTTSDYRAKENIVDMDAAKALAVINLLKPRSFTMKADGSHQDGFIAHELQEHIPLAVTGEKDAVVPAEHGAGPRMLMQGVDLSKVVPYLVAAMQEQQRLIDMLRQQIEVLTPPPENG